jgi:hypothetical protein
MKNYPTINDLIGIDPEKTYIGGGFRRDQYRIYDIAIDNLELTAKFDIQTDYSDTPLFHLTQTAAYHIGAQLSIGLYMSYKGISRQQDGVNFVISKYSTTWNEIIQNEKELVYQIKFNNIKNTPHRDIVKGTFSIENGKVTGEYEGSVILNS